MKDYNPRVLGLQILATVTVIQAVTSKIQHGTSNSKSRTYIAFLVAKYLTWARIRDCTTPEHEITHSVTVSAPERCSSREAKLVQQSMIMGPVSFLT